MSACMFRMSNKWFKERTIEELENHLKIWENTIKEFNWDNFKPTNFESDRASGFVDNIIAAKCELYDRLIKKND